MLLVKSFLLLLVDSFSLSRYEFFQFAGQILQFILQSIVLSPKDLYIFLLGGGLGLSVKIRTSQDLLDIVVQRLALGARLGWCAWGTL